MVGVIPDALQTFEFQIFECQNLEHKIECQNLEQKKKKNIYRQNLERQNFKPSNSNGINFFVTPSSLIFWVLTKCLRLMGKGVLRL